MVESQFSIWVTMTYQSGQKIPFMAPNNHVLSSAKCMQGGLSKLCGYFESGSRTAEISYNVRGNK